MRILLLKLFLIFGLIFRFLIGNPYGILILLILLYLLLPKFTQITPFSFNELLVFIIDLSPQYKIAIVTSILTIIGFLIAFQIATSSWKQQMLTNLKLEAAKDINITYSRVTELITAIRIFVDLNLDLINKIKNNVPEIEIVSDMNFINSKHVEFLSNRDELSKLHIQSYQFYSRYSNVLAGTWNSFKQLESVNESLRLVAERMWILIPQISGDDPNYKETYLKYSDVNKLKHLSEQCNESHGYIAAVTGNISGKLTAPLFQLNLSSLVTIFQKSKWIEKTFSIMRKKNK